ncbi:MAG: zinc ABC transporter substrate-binding protein [Candidatus Thiodiazotropha sp. (ex Codakia rugifera)]|nr:zinc ABC transporter substrate-binding protein [Candidatus Thiodiazotropha sp. (ex Codakia rugifera)]
MKRTYSLVLFLIGMGLTQASVAKLNIFACEPEWASLVQALGGSQVTTTVATTAHQDPHRIEPRPSLIAKVRRADLLVCSGAELEIGWLPMLQRQAGNRKVLPGRVGYFETAQQVERLGIPEKLDRSMGDVHASGNPHVHLDPHRLLKIASALSERLITLDPSNTAHYRSRFDDFTSRWQQAVQQWQRIAEPLKGARVVVHHQDWDYLFDWLQIVKAGSLEPKPGLPTSAGHLAKLRQALKEEPAVAIIYTHYQSPKAANRLSQLTGIVALELPYTVGGGEGVTDLFSLYDETLKRLLKVIP